MNAQSDTVKVHDNRSKKFPANLVHKRAVCEIIANFWLYEPPRTSLFVNLVCLHLAHSKRSETDLFTKLNCEYLVIRAPLTSLFVNIVCLLIAHMKRSEMCYLFTKLNFEYANIIRVVIDFIVCKHHMIYSLCTRSASMCSLFTK